MSALDHQEGGTHYAKLKIQPIEYIQANGIGFAEGSVIKYVTRWRDKNGIADLKKARHFIDLLIELEEKNHILDATKKVWTHDKELPSSGIYADERKPDPNCKICKGTDSIYEDGKRIGWCVCSSGKTWDKEAIDAYHKRNSDIPPKAIYNFKTGEINYLDESQYTAQDMQAASLAHDAELDPALVELCSKTTIHADEDGWIEHHGNECPLMDGKTKIDVMFSSGRIHNVFADLFSWDQSQTSAITHWRYHKGE